MGRSIEPMQCSNRNGNVMEKLQKRKEKKIEERKETHRRIKPTKRQLK